MSLALTLKGKMTLQGFLESKQTSDHEMVINPQAMFAKLMKILMLTLQ
jgi:hypothetical protein